MAIRIFTCTACGHKMRFSGAVCHACYAKKHAFQSPLVISLGLAVSLFVLIALGLSAL